MVEMLENI